MIFWKNQWLTSLNFREALNFVAQYLIDILSKGHWQPNRKQKTNCGPYQLSSPNSASAVGSFRRSCINDKANVIMTIIKTSPPSCHAGAISHSIGMLQPKLTILSLWISIQLNTAPSGIATNQAIKTKISNGQQMIKNCSREFTPNARHWANSGKRSCKMASSEASSAIAATMRPPFAPVVASSWNLEPAYLQRLDHTLCVVRDPNCVVVGVGDVDLAIGET
jgi:hypothetical protein